NGSGQFFDTGRVLGTNNSALGVVGDVDGNGTLDVIYRNIIGPNNGVEVWLNDGHGNFTRSSENFGTNSISNLALVDLDGDGSLDLIISGATELRVFLNDGAGHFTENPASVASLTFNNSAVGRILTADLNGDGAMDLVLQDIVVSRPARVLLNDGHGILSDTGQRFGGGGSAAALADLNGDGLPDLFMPVANGSYVWLNDGTGFFTDSGNVYPNLIARDVKLADVNGDGTLDAIVINTTSGFPQTNRSTIYLNDGAGNFTDSHT
ncbi:MAG TPA: VCBS repeat-containing protein, partial [Candidatus Dormibacteraeota bacterium]|nr:VCBS repeat-containing protein [Candidatus Dormibacteraeota bacterium]